ncbi:MAG: hypothetical protein SOY17_05670 [Evtepia sp.]|nr:hypothetical protein [Evtepia sp.]
MKIGTRFAGLPILGIAADCARPAGTLAAEKYFFTGKAGKKMI